jgi:hypothetical protein
VVAQRWFVTVRPSAMFLAGVLSCENHNSSRHKKRAVATTTEPSRAKERRTKAGSRGLRDVIYGG